jgi:hypothetical protein
MFMRSGTVGTDEKPGKGQEAERGQEDDPGEAAAKGLLVAPELAKKYRFREVDL